MPLSILRLASISMCLIAFAACRNTDGVGADEDLDGYRVVLTRRGWER